MTTLNYSLGFIAIVFMAILLSSTIRSSIAPDPQKVRLSRLVIDSAYLADYKVLLQEEIEVSMAKEPGVLTLYAVFEKDMPTSLTILEMYTTEQAYQAHVKTPHFLKYKNGTLKMVKELQLIDTDPLIPGLKIK